MNGWMVVLAFGIGWLIAQSWKTIAGFVEMRKSPKKMNWREFVSYVTRSGGMPSGHSASMMAATTYIGLTAGFNTELFALALVTTLIVLYDATHVRYAVGKQGEVLNEILQKEGKKPLKVVEGHTLVQVAVGVMIGIVTGVVMGVIVKA